MIDITMTLDFSKWKRIDTNRIQKNELTPYSQQIFIDGTQLITSKDGYEALMDCTLKILHGKEYYEIEKEIETLVERIETLESNLNDYIDKFGKLDGGRYET